VGTKKKESSSRKKYFGVKRQKAGPKVERKKNAIDLDEGETPGSPNKGGEFKTTHEDHMNPPPRTKTESTRVAVVKSGKWIMIRGAGTTREATFPKCVKKTGLRLQKHGSANTIEEKLTTVTIKKKKSNEGKLVGWFGRGQGKKNHERKGTLGYWVFFFWVKHQQKFGVLYMQKNGGWDGPDGGRFSPGSNRLGRGSDLP